MQKYVIQEEYVDTGVKNEDLYKNLYFLRIAKLYFRVIYKILYFDFIYFKNCVRIDYF